MAKNTKPAAKKAATIKEAEVVKPAAEPSAQKETVVEKSPRRTWSVDSLFWGLLLVVLGGMFLLNNFGVLQVTWMELWRLWPLLVIAAGFSVLATRHWLWKFVSALFVIMALVAVVVVGTGQYAPPVGEVRDHEQSVVLDDTAKQVEVELEAGASSLDITSADTDDVVHAAVTGSAFELTKNTRTDDATQYVRIASERDHGWWMMSPGKNDWTVKLSERVPMKLRIEAGASRTVADLSELNLTSLRLDAGASSTELKLGNKATSLKVDIDSGASSLNIRVPEACGVSLKFEGGLSSKELADLKETAEGQYRSDNYDTATNKIDIVVDAGLSSLKLERY